MQTPKRQLEKRGTLVLAEFETEKGNEKYRCWSSSLKHIDGSQLALDELGDFWKHDMQVVPKQAIGFDSGFCGFETCRIRSPIQASLLPF